jgi:opacity protein-like surface antigen
MRKLSLFLALAFAGAAWGQTGELWFSYGESLLSNAGIGTLQLVGTPNDVKLDDGYRFGFRFGFNQGSHFGHEVQYAFNHTQFDTTAIGGAKTAMHFHQGGYNFLYYLLSDKSKVRPFGTAGVQFSDFVPPGGSVNYGSQNKFGANFGAGVKVHVKGMWAVRFDVREYVSGKPDFNTLAMTSGPLWQTEVSAGIGVGF